ncbi:hypothetical protein NIES4074_48280 [Cylindrospermum sp. NIES-4074]|nr:hypothetical protein NIES4074_48280 [Cylindrospermum sp. NIES-4074]
MLNLVDFHIRNAVAKNARHESAYADFACVVANSIRSNHRINYTTASRASAALISSRIRQSSCNIGSNPERVTAEIMKTGE